MKDTGVVSPINVWRTYFNIFICVSITFFISISKISNNVAVILLMPKVFFFHFLFFSYIFLFPKISINVQ